MHDELLKALQQSERGRRGWLDPERSARLVATVVVPAAVAIVVGFVYHDFAKLAWPPPPLMALAPLASYLALRRVTGSRVELVLSLVLACMVALLAMWGMAAIFGVFEAMECLSPNGGCIPW